MSRNGRADLLEAHPQRLRHRLIFGQILRHLQIMTALDLRMQVITHHHAPEVLHQAANLRLLSAVTRTIDARHLGTENTAEIRGHNFSIEQFGLRTTRHGIEQSQGEHHRLDSAQTQNDDGLIDGRHIAPATRIAAGIGNAQQTRRQRSIAKNRRHNLARPTILSIRQPTDQLHGTAQPDKPRTVIHQLKQTRHGFHNNLLHTCSFLTDLFQRNKHRRIIAGNIGLKLYFKEALPRYSRKNLMRQPFRHVCGTTP